MLCLKEPQRTVFRSRACGQGLQRCATRLTRLRLGFEGFPRHVFMLGQLCMASIAFARVIPLINERPGGNGYQDASTGEVRTPP